jgi:hypothetical protein
VAPWVRRTAAEHARVPGRLGRLTDWRNWRKRAFKPIAATVDIGSADRTTFGMRSRRS